jgi:hypothetical protein
MTYLETAVVDFLRVTPTLFVTRREIARKAMGREAFEENQRWIDAPLASLLAKGLIEKDESGHFRIHLGPPPETKRRPATPWNR